VAIGGVVVNFAARTKDAIRDVDKFARSLEKSGRSAKSAGSIIGNSLKFGAAGVAVAAVGAGVAFVDMAKAAYADAQAQAKLERSLKRIPGLTDAAAESTGAWVDKLQLLTGISDDELRTALGKLTLVTKDLTDAQKLSVLAADAAVGSGREFSSVATAMAKAVGGNTSALKRMFPQLDAGPDKVLTLKEAVDQLAKSYGGAAKAAEDNDLFGRLGTIWDQLKEGVGQAALAPLEELATWFEDPTHIDDVQAWITKLGEWSTSIGVDFAGKIKDFIDYLDSPDGKAAMDEWVSKAEDTADAVGTIAEAIEGVGGAITTATGYIGGFFSTIGKALQSVDDFYGMVQGLGKWLGLNDKERYGRSGSGGTWAKPVKPAKGVTGGAYANSNGTTVNVTINNPKAEPASTSTAAAIRAGKYLERGVPK